MSLIYYNNFMQLFSLFWMETFIDQNYEGMLLSLYTRIRAEWKWLTVKDTLTYFYTEWSIFSLSSFILRGPRLTYSQIKHFYYLKMTLHNLHLKNIIANSV
jgi:hypothetical protein